MKILIGSEFELQTLLLNAKKEVFDDIEKMKGFETYHKDKWVCHIKDYIKIKKRHLSTLPKGKAT